MTGETAAGRATTEAEIEARRRIVIVIGMTRTAIAQTNQDSKRKTGRGTVAANRRETAARTETRRETRAEMP